MARITIENAGGQVVQEFRTVPFGLKGKDNPKETSPTSTDIFRRMKADAVPSFSPAPEGVESVSPKDIYNRAWSIAGRASFIQGDGPWGHQIDMANGNYSVSQAATLGTVEIDGVRMEAELNAGMEDYNPRRRFNSEWAKLAVGDPSIRINLFGREGQQPVSYEVDGESLRDKTIASGDLMTLDKILRTFQVDTDKVAAKKKRLDEGKETYPDDARRYPRSRPIDYGPPGTMRDVYRSV